MLLPLVSLTIGQVTSLWNRCVIVLWFFSDDLSQPSVVRRRLAEQRLHGAGGGMGEGGAARPGVGETAEEGEQAKESSRFSYRDPSVYSTISKELRNKKY